MIQEQYIFVKNKHSGPTPDYAPEYKDFLTVVELMRTLQNRNLTNVESIKNICPF